MTSDIRDGIGTQKMMRSAPVGIIYVADYSKMKSYLGKDDDRKAFVAGTDAGFISQNIYLYCAAAGLSTTILGLVDRDALHERMGLEAHYKVMYTQVVGNALSRTPATHRWASLARPIRIDLIALYCRYGSAARLRAPDDGGRRLDVIRPSESPPRPPRSRRPIPATVPSA